MVSTALYLKTNNPHFFFKTLIPFYFHPFIVRPTDIMKLVLISSLSPGSLTFMPRTLRYLRDGGAELRHAYTTTPMCCPSRSSMLTGLYMHNHQVYTNNGNCSGPEWQATHETRTFATYLSNAGYRTGEFLFSLSYIMCEDDLVVIPNDVGSMLCAIPNH